MNRDPRAVFDTMRKKFARLYNKVKQNHEDLLLSGQGNRGHGFDHDLMVAQYAAIIADDLQVAEMAWVAAMMHSADRGYEPHITAVIIEEYLSLLPKGGFSSSDLILIREAVVGHSEMNSDLDNPVTIVLKDADRLANIGAINLIRGGQHRPNIPACIPETVGHLHPESSFKRPMSCYDTTFYILEWEKMLRTPKAKELGKQYFDFVRRFQVLVVHQQAEVGLWPWPEDDGAKTSN